MSSTCVLALVVSCREFDRCRVEEKGILRERGQHVLRKVGMTDYHWRHFFSLNLSFFNKDNLFSPSESEYDCFQRLDIYLFKIISDCTGSSLSHTGFVWSW